MNFYAFFHHKLTKYYSLTLLLGALLPFAFAPFKIFPLALIIPGLLAYIWHRLSTIQALVSGFLFGLAFFSVGVSWVYISLNVYGQMPPWLAFIVTLLFVCTLALFFALQAILTKLLSRHNPHILSYFFIVFPVTWVFFEWLRSWMFSGFPWLFIGYSQTSTILGAFAPVFGIYGVSIFTLWVSSAIVVITFDKLGRHKFFSIIIGVLILTISLLLSFSSWTRPAGKSIQFSLIQGNVEQSIKWNASHLNTSLNRYYNLTQSHWKSSIIVWPEAAIPTLKNTIEPFIDALSYLAKKNHSTIVTGIPVAVEKNGIVHYYNGLMTIGQDKTQFYFKEHLVPFGEYMPLHPLFRWFFNAVDIPMIDQTPGPKKQPPLKINNISIAPFICYEIAYPSQMLRQMNQNPNIILVVTDDSWFGQSIASAQHLQIAQMRARESGRYVLFSTNNGITAMIDPNGRLAQTLPTNKIDVLTTKVVPVEGKTPLMHWHYYPLIIMLFVLFLLNFWL
jgi:apolipoprotein N-acyltransferase